MCALHLGPEEHYRIGEELAADMFAPILRRHRVTIEQMAVLEPAVVESTFATCITVMREAMETAVAMGVPEQAARDFCLGHIRTELAVHLWIRGVPAFGWRDESHRTEPAANFPRDVERRDHDTGSAPKRARYLHGVKWAPRKLAG